MSSRPATGPEGRLRQQTARLAPGGRLWSESAVRRALPRVRAAGVWSLCPGGILIDSGPTWARYGPVTVGIAGYVHVTGTATAAGSLWVAAVEPDPGNPAPVLIPLPADPIVLSPSSLDFDLPPGPGGNLVGAGRVLWWRLEWNTPGMFSALCSTMVEVG
jgi:hypothetical protein